MAWWRHLQILSLGVAVILVAVCVASALPESSGGQPLERTRARENAQGTPVSTNPDPLDGPDSLGVRQHDPLDGSPQSIIDEDVEIPSDFEALSVIRSGRSSSAPDSSVTYDGNLSTAWPVGELDQRWIWFDLGKASRLRELRWATSGTGSLSIEVSDDREKWREIAETSLEHGWTGVKLREDVQFVRLTFSDESSDDVALIEFAAYGVRVEQGVGGSAAVEFTQERKQRADGRRDRKSNKERQSQRARTEAPAAIVEPEEEPSSSGIQVSARPGKTKCKGDKSRCRADKGETRVEENCATEGSCVIDVRADGGTAICDASGGDENEIGEGEGKQPGRGGRCEATADGGTVTIGDISP